MGAAAKAAVGERRMHMTGLASVALEEYATCLKQLLATIFQAPKGHPRSKPFHDHVLALLVAEAIAQGVAHAGARRCVIVLRGHRDGNDGGAGAGGGGGRPDARSALPRGVGRGWPEGGKSWPSSHIPYVRS